MKERKRPKWFAGALLLTMLLFFAVSPAQAFDTRSGDTVVIRAGEVIEDDLFVSANIFTLEGTVKGDLIVLGSTINIATEGVVGGDLMAAGQEVSIEGKVEDDARIAGMVLTLERDSHVGDDLVAAGYSLEIQSGSAVDGDMQAVAAQVLTAGDVAGDVTVVAGAFRLEGSIDGNVDADVGDPTDTPAFNPIMFMPGVSAAPLIPGGFTMAKGAKIGGKLTYTASEDADIPSNAVGGGITRREPVVPEEAVETVEPPPPTTGELLLKWFLRLLRRLFSLLIVGLLLAWVLPALLRKGAATLREQPLPCLGWGILAYILFFVALAALATLVGLLTFIFGSLTLGDLALTTVWAGLVTGSGIALGFKLAASYLAPILIGVLVGWQLLSSFNPELGEHRFWPLILGVLMYVILAAVPYLGILVRWLTIFMGLGALWLIVRDWLRHRPAAVEAEAPAIVETE